jgi:hypothetical protein
MELAHPATVPWSMHATTTKAVAAAHAIIVNGKRTTVDKKGHSFCSSITEFMRVFVKK